MEKTKELNIESKEELAYVMDFYKIPFVPVFDNGSYLGKVTRSMKYEKSRTGYSLRDGYHDLAFGMAFKQIKDVIALKKALDKEVTVTRTRFNRHHVWMYPDYSGAEPTHHVYPKTVTDEEHEEMTGTLREIFDNTYYRNDRLRYCNGIWLGFKDKNLDKQYRLFKLMDWNKELPITLNDTF